MRRAALLLLLSGVLPFALEAQQTEVSPRCGARTATGMRVQDACQKALDLFGFAVPQIGTGLAAGSAVLGPPGTLGGPGTFAISMRVNGIFAEIPRAYDVRVTRRGARRDTYEVDSRLVPLPALDAAAGVFDGIAAGPTRVLALDILGSVNFVPRIDGRNIALEPDGSGVRLGYGARIGLLTESNESPAVTVSLLRRDLPSMSLTADVDDDRLIVRDTHVATTAWRLMAGRRFGVVGVHAGVGRDYYDMSAVADVHITNDGRQIEGGPFAAEQTMTRTVVTGGASVKFGALSAVAEVGHVDGGEIETYNAYEGTSADAPRTFVTLGLQLGR
jgi:hypothetical protein